MLPLRSCLMRCLRLWLASARPRRCARPRSFRPTLTALEPRDCPANYSVTSGQTTIPFHAGKAGDSVSYQVSYSTSDPDDVSREGEYLRIHSSTGAFADFDIPPVYGQTPVPTPYTFKATDTIESITATIVGDDGYDGDETAVIQTFGTVIPQRVEAVPGNGSLKIHYSVTDTLPRDQKIPVGVYWGSGPKGSDALGPDGDPQALAKWDVDSGQTPGHDYTHVVTADELVTAPPGATYLLVVADPDKNLTADSDEASVLAIPAPTMLSAAQLQKLMPGLGGGDAGTFAAQLNSVMSSDSGGYSINTLERRAMFLGQIAHESANLTLWAESPNQPKSYFINRYWVATSQWSGLGASIPTTTGLTIRIAATGTAQTKAFELHWQSKTGTLIDTPTFTRQGTYFVYNWAGAAAPDKTANLVVVDPVSHSVKATINNHLGNFQPDDAYDFRGSGPMQITGRYNFAVFSAYAKANLGVSDLMTNPDKLRNKANPILGFQSAAWYWRDKGNNCNTIADNSMWGSSYDFTLPVSIVINGKNKATGLPNGLDDRLKRYEAIRVKMLSSDF